MLLELVNRMTPADRARLRVAGVPDARPSEWKKGKGKPTYSQLKALAYVMDVSFYELANAIADETASPEMLEYFRRIEAQGGPKSAQGALFSEDQLPPQPKKKSHALRAHKPRP
jgi:transcriptional regulator with XRE-family HTH domain